MKRLFSIISIIFLIIVITGCSSSVVSQSYVEKCFEKDKDYLFKVNEYLSGFGNEIIIYLSDMGISMKFDGEDFPIEETGIFSELEKLSDLGYKNIEKAGNYISYLRWSDLDSGRGIVYSVDGNKPDLPFLTKIEPLGEENWYYYEEDYNEWESTHGDSNIPEEILGTWNIRYAKTRGVGRAVENYPLQDLYGTGIQYGGKLTFKEDGTFSRYVGITTDETEKYEGTYYIHYDEKIMMQYYDGTERTAKYLPESQEIVLYTWDNNGQAIDEFYSK